MGKGFISKWLEDTTPKGAPKNVRVLTEQAKKRSVFEKSIRTAVLENLVGAKLISSMGGYEKASKVIQNALPSTKIGRSGDLGEILATEFVAQETEYEIPIRRLRFKDDRQMAMRGDDVLGFVFGDTPVRILKAESKSRKQLSASVLKAACDGLCRHRGRPNPSTLSFISRRLREAERHDLAEQIENLQSIDIKVSALEHLIFTLSGNAPGELLAGRAASPIKGIKRILAGCHISDHPQFVKSIFDAVVKALADGKS